MARPKQKYFFFGRIHQPVGHSSVSGCLVCQRTVHDSGALAKGQTPKGAGNVGRRPATRRTGSFLPCLVCWPKGRWNTSLCWLPSFYVRENWNSEQDKGVSERYPTAMEFTTWQMPSYKHRNTTEELINLTPAKNISCWHWKYTIVMNFTVHLQVISGSCKAVDIILLMVLWYVWFWGTYFKWIFKDSKCQTSHISWMCSNLEES